MVMVASSDTVDKAIPARSVNAIADMRFKVGNVRIGAWFAAGFIAVAVLFVANLFLVGLSFSTLIQIVK